MSDNFGGDSFTVTSSESWFERLKGAVLGVIFGIVLIPGSIWLLGWNESHAVTIARALGEGSGAVVSVAAQTVDPANQGHLVHVSGPLAVPGALADSDYGVQAPGAAQLVRTAQMFVWREHQEQQTRNKLGGGTETVTTYRYTREWSDTAVDSTRFRQQDGHANPPWRVPSRTLVADSGQIGAFRLDRDLLAKLGPATAFTLESAPAKGVLADGAIYLGADPQTPALGDVKLTYTVVHPEAASVIGQQDGGGFKAFTTRNGRTLLMVSAGEETAAAMFKEAQDNNRLLAWALRGGGVLAMLIGFYLIMRPMAVLADVVPLFGSIVGAGAGLVALLCTVMIAPIVIAVAWLAVRPLVGGGVLAAGLVLALLIIRQMRARKAARTPAPPSSFFLNSVPK